MFNKTVRVLIFEYDRRPSRVMSTTTTFSFDCPFLYNIDNNDSYVLDFNVFIFFSRSQYNMLFELIYDPNTHYTLHYSYIIVDKLSQDIFFITFQSMSNHILIIRNNSFEKKS